MRKIFIRMGMTPMEGWTPDKVLLEDAIGGNAGNLIYQYSICRTLMTENTELIPSRYRYSPRQADEINHTCSHVVIPLADAFRATFTGGLKSLTKLVRAVKVPCVVIGAGLRAPLGTISYADFPFNTQARDFVKAVLDKSPVISIRGEQTAEYLKYLGFVPEKDFTVTGCPSFYLFGDRLEVRDISREKEGRICVNANPRLGPVSNSFLYRILRDCPESVFIPQLQTEFRMIYTGAPAIYEYHSATMCVFLTAADWTIFIKMGKYLIRAPLTKSSARFQRQVPSSRSQRFHGTSSSHAGTLFIRSMTQDMSSTGSRAPHISAEWKPFRSRLPCRKNC